MNILYQKNIAFNFKGKRTYVQGADIFDGILQASFDFFGVYPDLIKGSFYNFLEHNGLLCICDNVQSIRQDQYAAFFLLHIRNKEYPVLVAATKHKIVLSKEYHEKDVLEGAHIKGNAARLLLKPSYTYMEQIVALTKKIHGLVYPAAKGKWLFTKIELNDTIDPTLFTGQELVVEAKKNFHHKLTQNAIYLGEKRIGHIWYSLKV